ncbi:hypothetical protein, partial [Cronobacter dublinensis]|uniref:hypothetical protein n=1 Tax=Cronobacter dublinensis TaxID=413497 RepID=UPI001F1FECF5
ATRRCVLHRCESLEIRCQKLFQIFASCVLLSQRTTKKGKIKSDKTKTVKNVVQKNQRMTPSDGEPGTMQG